MNRNKE